MLLLHLLWQKKKVSSEITDGMYRFRYSFDPMAKAANPDNVTMGGKVMSVTGPPIALIPGSE